MGLLVSDISSHYQQTSPISALTLRISYILSMVRKNDLRIFLQRKNLGLYTTLPLAIYIIVKLLTLEKSSIFLNSKMIKKVI